MTNEDKERLEAQRSLILALEGQRLKKDQRIAELEADNGKLRSLLETWLNHPYNIPLRTRTKTALNKEQS